MSNIVSFPEKPVKDGEMAFLLCPCTDDGVPFAVGALVGDDPIIATLVCPECEQVLPVCNGYVGHGGE